MNTGPINAVLQHIRHLAAIEEYRGHSDSGLLERFLATKEEAAFAALLQRHGPLVWRVCHRVLQHRQNAEDIFQATFLTLAHKASSIRKPAMRRRAGYMASLTAWPADCEPTWPDSASLQTGRPGKPRGRPQIVPNKAVPASFKACSMRN